MKSKILDYQPIPSDMKTYRQTQTKKCKYRRTCRYTQINNGTNIGVERQGRTTEEEETEWRHEGVIKVEGRAEQDRRENRGEEENKARQRKIGREERKPKRNPKRRKRCGGTERHKEEEMNEKWE
ncbi:hypothetical protein Pcinc_043318 [Petrolisthes cinctipes]|uniref:Uncharacterized protein n=1 Tax=Petrolisthes cinctipes TaxID=88211 RepID=A0AAE1BGX5_PETCI|nr:hypothetical protein Pcinc_043318 [Petrolisthes cinctipes]